jgi:hypothetical protein
MQRMYNVNKEELLIALTLGALLSWYAQSDCY